MQVESLDKEVEAAVSATLDFCPPEMKVMLFKKNFQLLGVRRSLLVNSDLVNLIAASVLTFPNYLPRGFILVTSYHSSSWLSYYCGTGIQIGAVPVF